MSREAGKQQPEAKRQARPPRKGERLLKHQALTLDTKADNSLEDSSHHSALLSQQDTSDIQTSVQKLQLEAERLKSINSKPKKSRSKPLDTVDEINSKQSSSEGEEDEAHSRLGSMDTHPYAEISSPFTNSMMSKSPFHVELPPATQIQNTPPYGNPQFGLNPPQTIPNVAAGPIDPLAMMQAMFAQQAMANR